jgi:hypothetical protein
VLGALYFDTTSGKMRVFTASGWIDASSASVATLGQFQFNATAGQTTFSGTAAVGGSLSYTVGAVLVALNGVLLEEGADFTASNGSSIVLASGAASGDELNVYAFGSFLIADTYTKAESNALLAAKQNSLGFTPVNKAGDVMTGALEVPYVNAKGATGGVAFHHRDAQANSFQWYAEANRANLFSSVLGGNVESMDTTGQRRTIVPGGGVTQYPSYDCRAWVNFNGTGTVTIRASGNVSSVSDLGVGKYQVNFATAMPDTNFAALMTGGSLGAYGTLAYEGLSGVSPFRTTTSITLETSSNIGSYVVDDNAVAVAVFR